MLKIFQRKKFKIKNNVGDYKIISIQDCDCPASNVEIRAIKNDGTKIITNANSDTGKELIERFEKARSIKELRAPCWCGKYICWICPW